MEYSIEKQMLGKGYRILAGVDEVGRGCLAGPVVTACVVLPLDEYIEGVTDSKALSPKRREKLAELIKSKAIEYTISQVEAEVVDEINILNATKRAMSDCINKLSTAVDCVLIDAVKLNDVKYKTEAFVKGDSNSYLIGAASILAKVYRDNLMTEYAKTYPQYDFEHNKGYGTAKHIGALRQFGAIKLHRVSFIGNFINE